MTSARVGSEAASPTALKLPAPLLLSVSPLLQIVLTLTGKAFLEHRPLHKHSRTKRSHRQMHTLLSTMQFDC